MTRGNLPAHIEVTGGSLKSLVDAMEFLKLKARQILKARGIDPFDPTQWYPLPAVVGCYQDILAQVGPSTLRSVGRHVPKNAVFPPHIDTFESALHSLDQAYRMNHRGSGDIGGYHFHPGGPRTARMVCDNPYPCEFDQGIIEALYDRFQPKGSILFRIEHDASGCREKGARACTYQLRW
jgi:hypothetical protein